jgi:hypothetical protein
VAGFWIVKANRIMALTALFFQLRLNGASFECPHAGNRVKELGR